jgi:hypothetical protein
MNKQSTNTVNSLNSEQQKKDLNKLLVSIEQDYVLPDYLNLLTKPELTEIVKRLELKGTSSLNKKQLIELLNNEIRKNIPEILEKMTEKEFYFVLLLLSKEGLTYINLKEKAQRVMVQSLRQWGIGFTGTLKDLGTFAVIPKDILPNIKSCIDNEEFAMKISERQKWLRATAGVLYYYGVMESNNLFNTIKTILDYPMDYNQYISAVDQDCKYGNLIKKDKDLYYFSKVENPEFIYEMQLEKKGISFSQIDLKQIFQAGMEEYSEWSDIEKELNDLIVREFGTSTKQAEKLINDCIYLMKNNYQINSIIDVLGRGLGAEDEFELQSISKLINDMYMNTRLWILKGNSQNSIFKDLGRNDICPCGSGKKYKKCCSRNS